MAVGGIEPPGCSEAGGVGSDGRHMQRWNLETMLLRRRNDSFLSLYSPAFLYSK